MATTGYAIGSTNDTETDHKKGRLALICALVFFGVVNIPLALSNTIFGGDDWAWVWIYRTQGAASILRYMVESGHPGYGPLLDFVLFLGGDHVGQAAHIAAISFYLASGWMIWQIFRAANVAPGFALTLAVLYLGSPYLANLHASLAHSHYEFVIFIYLASIRLSQHRGIVALTVALIGLVIGLTLQPLVVLEAMRVWLFYHKSKSVRQSALAEAPYCLLVFFTALIYLVFFQPQGIYAGYNSVIVPSISEYLRLVFVNLLFFVDIRQPLAFAFDLARFDTILIFAVLAFGAFIIARIAPLKRAIALDPAFAALAVLSLMMIAVGILFYVVIGREASRVDYSSRFGVAAQFGFLVLGAIVLNLLRPASLRILALFSFVLLFSADQLQLYKWLTFEGKIVGDFRGQVGTYLQISGPMMFVVDFNPPTKKFLYVQRACLSSYDMNVSLEIAGRRYGAFVFDRACGPDVHAPARGCSVTAYDPTIPCPVEHGTASFTLRPDRVDFYRFRLVDLINPQFLSAPFDFGTLQPARSTP